MRFGWLTYRCDIFTVTEPDSPYSLVTVMCDIVVSLCVQLDNGSLQAVSIIVLIGYIFISGLYLLSTVNDVIILLQLLPSKTWYIILLDRWIYPSLPLTSLPSIRYKESLMWIATHFLYFRRLRDSSIICTVLSPCLPTWRFFLLVDTEIVFYVYNVWLISNKIITCCWDHDIYLIRLIKSFISLIIAMT